MAKPKVKFVPVSLHVKTGDTVFVISGKDKGKTGKIVKVFPNKGKVVVEGINMVTHRTHKVELLLNQLLYSLQKLCYLMRKQVNQQELDTDLWMEKKKDTQKYLENLYKRGG